MKEITRYTFLNLEDRPDRKLLARCTASRDGIPDHLVYFWSGRNFEKISDVARAAVDDGFENFRPFLNNNNPLLNTTIGQNYNVMRYLTDRITREDTIEVFLHDDVYFTPPFCLKVHSHLSELCQIIQEKSELNILVLDPEYRHIDQIGDLDVPILKGSLIILDGIYGSCDYARVYSTKGAQLLLDKMMGNNPFDPIELFFMQGWNPPGTFTTACKLVKRYNTKIVGSDTYG